jgi:hypothetical protein
MELRVDSHLKMQHRRRPKSPRKNKDKVNESPKELSISWPSIKRTSSWPQQTSSSTIKPITPRLKACLLWVLSRVKTAEISSKSKTKLVLDNWTKRRNKIIIKSMDRKFISMLPCCKMKAIRLTLERKDRYHNRKTFLSYPRIWFSHRIRIVVASSSHLFNRVLRLWLDHKLLVRRTKLSRARRRVKAHLIIKRRFNWVGLRSIHRRKSRAKELRSLDSIRSTMEAMEAHLSHQVHRIQMGKYHLMRFHLQISEAVLQPIKAIEV